MKILKLPFFIIRLTWENLANFFQLVSFKLAINKLVVINILLTLIIIGLNYAWTRLPYPQPVSPPNIGLETAGGLEVAPIYFTWDQGRVNEELLKYQDKILRQDFISQADYINLAVLAQASEKYEQANEYLKLARYIDPNREIFVK